MLKKYLKIQINPLFSGRGYWGFLSIMLVFCCTCGDPQKNPKHEKTDQLVPFSRKKTAEQSPDCPTPSEVPVHSTLLSKSEELASDLEAAAKLQPHYQKLTDKIDCKAGNSTDPTFVGIEGMKKALKNEPSGGNLTLFKKWAKEGTWEKFHSYHYDWWMFPIYSRPTYGYGLKYTVCQQDIEELKKDKDWLKDYRLGAILLMQSWGWDVENRCFYQQPGKGQKWTDYQVRLGKLATSLILFKQWDLYQSLEEMVIYLRDNRGFVKGDYYVKSSFPDI